MRKFIATYAAMATIAVMAPIAANAQGADPKGATSLEPLTRIVDGFVAGEEVDGLYLQSEYDTATTGLSQFQVIANLGPGPTFGEQGLEMAPSGISPDGDLVSLEDVFGGTIGATGQVPPLAPFARGQAMDLTPVFEGWTIYGVQGLVEGPLEILEQVQVIAGIELAEPYNPECTETTYVGRAWGGTTVPARDPLLTSEALANWYSNTSHSALADRASRLIELTCTPGLGPQMSSFRMKEDTGIRPFGPLETFALVQGNHVVLIAPIRVLDADLTQRFYATPSGGGDVEVTEVEDKPRLLVPNPYGSTNVRIDLRVVKDPTDEGAANAQGNTGATRSLLYSQDTGAIIPVQTGGGCTFTDTVIHILQASFQGLSQLQDLANELFGNTPAQMELPDWYSFGSTSSGSGTIGSQDGSIVSTISDASGSSQTATLNSDGTGVFTVANPGNGSTCKGGLEYDMSPNLFDLAGNTPDATDSGSTSNDTGNSGEQTGATGSAGEDTGGAGGVPWGPIGIAIGLLAVAIGTAVIRRRSGTKDCKPEQQAYDAAASAYATAKKVSDYYVGQFDLFNGQYNDHRNTLDNRLGAPDRKRGYPEGPDGDKAYADAKADWDTQEAKAERSQDNLDGTRQLMEEAKREMDEAIKAQQIAADVLERAREALQACQGSAPETPGDTETPPPSPASPGGETPTSPGIITDPPDTTQPDCLEGTTKVKIESQKSFEILEGEVQILLNKTKLNDTYPGGLIDPDQLKAMDEAELQDLFSQLEENIKEETMRWVINTTILSVKCIRIVICQNGAWVETDQTNRVEERAKGPTYQKATKTQSKVLAQRLMESAQAKIKELQASETAAGAFTCD